MSVIRGVLQITALVVLAIALTSKAWCDPNPLCDSIQLIEDLKLGMSVEEIVRVMPNVKRAPNIEYSVDGDPLDKSWTSDVLLDRSTESILDLFREEGPFFKRSSLALVVENRRLVAWSVAFLGTKAEVARYSEDTARCVTEKLGANYDSRVGLTSRGLLPVVVWRREKGFVALSASESGIRAPAADEPRIQMMIRVAGYEWACSEGPAEILLRLTTLEEQDIYRKYGLEGLYRPNTGAAAVGQKGSEENPCITKHPLQHYVNTLHATNVNSEQLHDSDFIYGVRLNLNATDKSEDVFVISAAVQKSDACRWRLYWGTTDRFVSDGEVTLGRFAPPAEDRALWALYHLQSRPCEGRPSTGILGFLNSSDQDCVDVVVTAFYPGAPGGKLETRTLAAGVSFETWDEFETWFAEQDTGWHIVKALQVTATPVSELKHQLTGD